MDWVEEKAEVEEEQREKEMVFSFGGEVGKEGEVFVEDAVPVGSELSGTDDSDGKSDGDAYEDAESGELLAGDGGTVDGRPEMDLSLSDVSVDDFPPDDSSAGDDAEEELSTINRDTEAPPSDSAIDPESSTDLLADTPSDPISSTSTDAPSSSDRENASSEGELKEEEG